MSWIRKAPAPQPKVIPQTPTEYPDGICVKSETGYWYIKGKLRFSVPTQRVFESWSFPNVMETSESALTNYVKGGRIGFRSGTLLYNSGNFYIISGNVSRRIANPDVLTTFGLSVDQAVWVADEELEIHKNGEVFN